MLIYSMVFPLTSEKQTQDVNPPLLLKRKMDEIVNKSLSDRVDLMHYVDPDLFDLGPLTPTF